MRQNKWILAALLVAAACLMLSACTNDDAGVNRGAPNISASPAPTAAATANPGAAGTDTGSGATSNSDRGDTAAPGTANGNTASTAPGAATMFDWANGAAEIERAIAQISELSDARVVVTNSTALVGVKFDNAYKGELTERIREMVAAEVLRADPNIQTVAVTSTAGDVEKVYQLAEQIRAGRTASELSDQINSIVRSATTLR